MDIGNYYVLALNHKATAIQNIGDFTIDNENYDSIINKLLETKGIQEVVYLSTCNRVEVWIYANDQIQKNQIVNKVFNGVCFGRLVNIKEDFFELQGELALLHMINVACSLDSMVVGEREIFGQLRKAFIKANGIGACGKNLNLAFRKITEVSKKVYSKTDIAKQKVSVASIACHELRKIIPNVDETSLSLIGAGETIQLVSKYLANHSFQSIKVFNRSKENPEKVAQIIPNVAIGSWNDFEKEFEKTDVIITCTGSVDPIINKDQIHKDVEYTILDLAIPADTSIEVQQMENVNFIGVNDLKDIAKQNIKGRLQDLNIASSTRMKVGKS